MSLVVGSNPLSIAAVAKHMGEQFGELLTDVRLQQPDTVVAHCSRERLAATAAQLKADAEIGYETLNFIAGLDHVTSFEAVYHLYSWKTNTYLELHVELPHDDPTVVTVTDVWPCADWHEREAWDMVGIVFSGHPDPRRILLKDDFVGHPLRKDYIDLPENHPHV